MRLFMHWNKLSRPVTDVPSLEMLKVRLDGALINLMFDHGRGIGLDDFIGPFQPKQFYDSVKFTLAGASCHLASFPQSLSPSFKAL